MNRSLARLCATILLACGTASLAQNVSSERPAGDGHRGLPPAASAPVAANARDRGPRVEIEPKASQTAYAQPAISAIQPDEPKPDPWFQPSVIMQMVAAAVLFLTVLQASRAAILNRFNTQAQAFIQLRAAFAKLRTDLPQDFATLKKVPEALTPIQQYAFERYWHQAFDEWLMTQKLHPLTLGRLWEVYYRDSIHLSAQSPVMLSALLRAEAAAGSRVDKEFVKTVLQDAPTKRWWISFADWLRGLRAKNRRAPEAIPQSAIESAKKTIWPAPPPAAV